MDSDTFIQPKITGYRQLSEAEAALINEAKALAEQCGAFIEKLRKHPQEDVPVEDRPRWVSIDTRPGGVVTVGDMLPTVDQRWVSIGATQLQQGFMAVIRGIAQPTTF